MDDKKLKQKIDKIWKWKEFKNLDSKARGWNWSPNATIKNWRNEDEKKRTSTLQKRNEKEKGSSKLNR